MKPHAANIGYENTLHGSVPQQATLFSVPTETVRTETTPKPESGQGQNEKPKYENRVKKTTAPHWTQNVDDRVAYACWMLNCNPQVYIAYRSVADAQRFKNPFRRISSEDIVNKLRHHTLIRADGDYFKVNSNAKSLFAALYKLERTDAKIGKKKRWLDYLTDEQWQSILTALKNLNDPNP